ncbi:MAG: hypothetical protein GKR90_25640 [Pseudomonadales bacterium]|nr:hypothetical protein [Pseudomonadales bacterium]
MQAMRVPLYQIELSERRPVGATVVASPTLTRRIEQQGIVEPLVVRPKGPKLFELLTNPQVYFAAGELSLHEVPVVIREDLTDEEAQKIVASNYSEKLIDPIAEAEALKGQLAEIGGEENIARLARILGKSRSQLSRKLALLDLSQEAQQAIREGRLSPTHGRLLVAEQDPRRRRWFTNQAIDNKWSTSELERRLKAKQQRAEKPSPKTTEVERLERRLMDLVGMDVCISEDKGLITFNYYKNLDSLQGLLERLGYSDES